MRGDQSIWRSLDAFTVLTMLSLGMVGGQWGLIAYGLQDFADNVGRDSTDISIIFVAYLVGSIPGSFVGPVYDLFPSRVISIHILLMIFMAISTGFLGFFSTYASLCLGFGIAGCAATSVFSSVPILTIWHLLEDSGPLLSLNWCAVALGGTLVPAGMYVLKGYPLEVQIVGAFCMPCVAIVAGYGFFREDDTLNPDLGAEPDEEQRAPLLAERASPFSTISQRTLFFLAGLFLTSGQGSYNTLIETYAEDFLEMSSSEASVTLIAFFGAFTVGSIGSAVLLDLKADPAWILTWFSLALVAFTCAPLVSISSWALFWTSSVASALCYGFLFGPLIEETREWYGGSGMALFPLTLGFNIGGAMGPVVCSELMYYTSDDAFVYCTFAFAVCFACVLLLMESSHAARTRVPIL